MRKVTLFSPTFLSIAARLGLLSQLYQQLKQHRKRYG